jgi:hypothetical protein
MGGDLSHMPSKSAQEKEAEYYQARERLLGKGPAFDPAGAQPYGRGRGGRCARGRAPAAPLAPPPEQQQQQRHQHGC